MQCCGNIHHSYEYLERWLKSNDPNSTGLFLQPLIIGAVSVNHLNCLKLLVSSGADINISNWSNETAVYKASEYGHLDCLRYLLDLKADCGRSQMWCTSALDIAILYGYKDCALTLIDHGFTFNRERLYNRIEIHGDKMELPPIDQIESLIEECEMYMVLPDSKEPGA